MVPDCLSYHQRLCDHLKTHEKAIWDWFASDKISHKAFDEQRLTLLKSAVRLDTDNHGALIASAQEVAGALEITTPLALYQGSEDSRNAALIYTPGEVNLLFQGDTLERLDPTELKALKWRITCTRTATEAPSLPSIECWPGSVASRAPIRPMPAACGCRDSIRRSTPTGSRFRSVATGTR